MTKAIQDAPPHYSDLEVGKGVRKPVEILNHMSYVLLLMVKCYQEHRHGDLEISSWETEVDRIYTILEQLDTILSDEIIPTGMTVEQLLQGPMSDALTHVGQLIMLRRLADSPVPGERYTMADIRIGQIRPK